MPCDHQFVTTTTTRQVTPVGVMAAAAAIAGVLIMLCYNAMVGGLVVAAALVSGMVGRSKQAIVCAKCGEAAPHQPT